MENLYGIYGASGHGKVVIEILENSAKTVSAIFDDDISKKFILKHNVTNNKEIFQKIGLQWIIAIGNNKIRKKVAERSLFHFGVAIAQNANISAYAKINNGTVVMPGVCINSSSVIGSHSIINTAAVVDHDCLIDDFVHISPNTTLCGGVSIGEGSHIGAGAVVIPGIKIGKWTTVGAGAVIIRDIPDFATVVGNPGKIIKVNKNEF